MHGLVKGVGNEGWRDGSVVRESDLSSRGHWFDSRFDRKQNNLAIIMIIKTYENTIIDVYQPCLKSGNHAKRGKGRMLTLNVDHDALVSQNKVILMNKTHQRPSRFVR